MKPRPYIIKSHFKMYILNLNILVYLNLKYRLR